MVELDQELKRSRKTRCAIYTRKSSEEGLEQAFNSLDAQREACVAFILSQKHEGWTVSPTLYDDGGFSGGTMDRPALKRLITDIEEGRIDAVVVYKVDRLTRALSDFSKLVDVFDRHGVSFVSITQQFNTNTSMGRLTLNVLLSFAQFEREVIGERVRDKIAASKKKGMWMGGMPPLGYDVQNRKLIVNDAEARTVVEIFQRYLMLTSVHALRDELARAGITSKRRTRRDNDAPYGGQPFSRGALYLILKNRLYRGEMPHKGNAYPGEHSAIVDKPLWDEVQAVLAANRVERVTGGRARTFLTDHGALFDALDHESHGCERRQLVERSRQLAEVLRAQAPYQVKATLMALLRRVEIRADRVEINVSRAGLTALLSQPSTDPAIMPQKPTDDGDDLLTLKAPARLKRVGREMRMLVANANDQTPADPSLLRIIARAHDIQARLAQNTELTVHDIARAEGVSGAYIYSLLRLPWLAPDITAAIINGRNPPQLTAKKLMRLTPHIPISWAEQRNLLGFR